MKKIIIIGARGYGRHVYDLAKTMKGFGSDFIVKGFLDDKADALDSYDNYPPILSSVESYALQENDVFVCALGDVRFKKKYIDIIIQKGGEFFSIIPSSVKIGSNAVVGKGCVLGFNTIIDCDAHIGDFVTIQENVAIGHDVVIGDNSMIDSFSFLGGFSIIGKNVTIHTSSVIVPRITVEEDSVINAGSVVIRNVNKGSIMMGNPAKKLLIPNIK